MIAAVPRIPAEEVFAVTGDGPARADLARLSGMGCRVAFGAPGTFEASSDEAIFAQLRN